MVLTVLDDGVKIGLQPIAAGKPAWHRLWYQWTWLGMASLLAAIGAANALGWLTGAQTGIAIIVVVIASAVVNWLGRRSQAGITDQPIQLSGGYLHVRKATLTHTDATGKITPITLDNTNHLQIDGDTLQICHADGTPRCRVMGFTTPQHLHIAHAVLQGKSIQTNAKSVRLNTK